MLALGRPRAGGAFAARDDTLARPQARSSSNYIESMVTTAPSRGFQLSLRGLLSVAASSADSLELEFLAQLGQLVQHQFKHRGS